MVTTPQPLSTRKKFPLRPKHPERVCWGCDKYCPAHAMRCGNGSDRTQHPSEVFGPDWAEAESLETDRAAAEKHHGPP